MQALKVIKKAIILFTAVTVLEQLLNKKSKKTPGIHTDFTKKVGERIKFS
ncbi:TPA: hypothetical protein O1956_001868 [Staphylococcus aureus]|nr:hypothetical protein [Staphylococcus aureus]SCU37727.1 Uncharacterised protein [Staphylococcus aureus]HCY8319033.1 hypothetical protein [Staphylococcus aureus]HDA1660303.1 hypothetical protein [Staphylococcus aureus]HDA2515614.1 hypothetical protein [Staphylococcus aureus]HDJ1601775.1 hypothetical protein [Staphylococcus aureus]